MTLEKALEIVSLMVKGEDVDPDDLLDALQVCLKALTFLEHLFCIIQQMKPIKGIQLTP